MLRERPTLLLFNGAPLLEKDFDTEIHPADILSLMPQPGIAFAVVGWIITAVVTAYSLYTAYSNKPPKIGDKSDQSPTYSVSYRGNHAKPGGVIPVVYGKTRVFFDIGAAAYPVFDVNNDQTLYSLFEATKGYSNITDLKYEETALANFEAGTYDYEIAQPGVVPALVPHSFETVAGVDDLTLTTSWGTAYQVCDLADDVVALYCDYVAPEGIYLINSLGDYRRHAVDIEVRFRRLDVSPIGAWETITLEWGESWEPIRRTLPILLVPSHGRTPGCYEVQSRRTVADVNDQKTFERVVWTGLRGMYARTDATDTTRVAVKVRASGTIGNGALSKFSGVVERKLPIWNGATWSAPTATQHPVWAFADMVKASYGGGLTDNNLDLAGLLQITVDYPDAKFNGVFDTKSTLWEILEEIARPLFAKPVIAPGEVYTLIVDDENAPEAAIFTMRNMVKDSFSIQRIGLKADSADSVDVTFNDQNQGYRETTISCVPVGSAGANPEKVQLRGATHYLAAFAQGFRIANEHFYRRDWITFETGIEAYLPIFLKPVLVQHYLFAAQDSYGAVSGDIVSYNGTDQLTVNEDLTAHAGQTGRHCYLRELDGTPQGPLNCTVLGQVITITEAFDDSCITFADNLQRPVFTLGDGEAFMRRVKITEIEPTGPRTLRLTGYIDNPNAFIGASAPTATTLPTPFSLIPYAWSLRFEAYGNTAAPRYKLSWFWNNVDHGRVEIRINGGAWNIVAENVREPELVVVPPYAASVEYRVFPISLLQGWAVTTDPIDTTAYALTPPIIDGVHSPSEPVGTFDVQYTAPPPGHRTEIEVWWNAALKRTVILGRDIDLYQYNFFNAIEDDPTIFNGTKIVTNGVRTVTYKLRSINDNGDTSDPVTLIVKNEQVAALQGVTYIERGSDLRINYLRPDLRDFSGVQVHISEVPGFTPSGATLKYSGADTSIGIDGVLLSNTVYYVRLAGYDLWGDDELTYSLETQISTIDDILGGDILWRNIRDPDGTKPDDGATIDGRATASLDPRFTKSAAAGSFAPWWQANGLGWSIDQTGGEDGGPCAKVEYDAEPASWQKLLMGTERIPVSLGQRILCRAHAKYSGAPEAGIEVPMYDRTGAVIDHDSTIGAWRWDGTGWAILEGVITITNSSVRSIWPDFVLTPNNDAGTEILIDNFDVWVLAPELTDDNKRDYLPPGIIDTIELGDGSVTGVTISEDNGMTGFASVTPPGASTWTGWESAISHTVDFIGRKASTPLVISDWDVLSFRFKHINAGTIAGCRLKVRLVRYDATGSVAFEHLFIDDVARGNTFTLPINTGIDPYDYGRWPLRNPWSTNHGLVGRQNIIDPSPNDGLNTYSMEFNFYQAASGLTSLSYIVDDTTLASVSAKA